MDKKFLHSLYVNNSLRLFRVVMKIVKDDELSKDIVHDAFVKAAININSLRDETKVVGWLYKIAVNQAISVTRNKKRITSVSLEILETKKYVDLNDPLKHLTDQELKKEISSGLETLDPISDIIMTLFYYEKLKIKQISQILQMPTGTVKSRLNRAKRKLREYILANNTADINIVSREGDSIWTIDSKNAYGMSLSKK